MNEIKSIEEWNTLKKGLTACSYRLWQMQFDIHHPDGFLSCFISTGKPDQDFTTHDLLVANAIVSYNGT